MCKDLSSKKKKANYIELYLCFDNFLFCFAFLCKILEYFIEKIKNRLLSKSPEKEKV